jgi:YebC/PmpR family DNA-binding regulatory protein
MRAAMSGHSKWSKVKHQKATTDAAKSQAFTRVSRALAVAVREGGGMTDPAKNFRLRLAFELARAVNMPKDTIERAIERGSGQGVGAIEQLTYEGYGPGGVAYLVEAATDNHQRTGAMVKHAFDHAGGSLAAPGAVTYQFHRSGVLLIPKSAGSVDTLFEVALSAGADDVVERDDVFEMYTKDWALPQVKAHLEKAGIPITQTSFIMRPSSTIRPDTVAREKNEQLIEALEILDDVQNIFTTME